MKQYLEHSFLRDYSCSHIRKTSLIPALLLAFALLLSSGVLTINCFAQTIKQSANTDSTRIDALLWQVSGNGLSSPSYLFGTIHLICKNDIVMPQATKRCLAASKQLALEFDLSKVNEKTMMSAMDEGVLMRDGITLRQLLDSTSYVLLDKYFIDSVGMSLRMMERFKPMVLSMMLLEAGGSESECEETSYEEEFMEIAKKQKKPIVGVETMQQQLELFDRIPYKEQAMMLLEEIKSALNPQPNAANALNLTHITTLYKQGKISELVDAMRAETVKSMPNGTQFEEILLNERNRAWIPKIEMMMRKKATFIAVGAGHLAGTQGVVSLLRKRGYMLSPLK